MRKPVCGWAGKACDCEGFPWLVEEKLPAKCQSLLTLPMAELWIKKIDAEKAAEVKRWVAAGRPRLDRWVGENDDEGSANIGDHDQ